VDVSNQREGSAQPERAALMKHQIRGCATRLHMRNSAKELLNKTTTTELPREGHSLKKWEQGRCTYHCENLA
jgi:hypothetical protein